MGQSPLLEFESSDFIVIPGEDDATNPGIYGKALASWLAGQLSAAGFPARPIIAEDFGWCVPIDGAPHTLFVTCASTGERPNSWRVYAFAEGGMVRRLFGMDESATTLASLFNAVRSCLESDPSVRNLREEPADA
jgi:hypothetical protein